MTFVRLFKFWLRQWWFWVATSVVVVVLVSSALGADWSSERTDPLEPDHQTCVNLQALINTGMTKRAAINFAIIQADEPELDGTLRQMLYRCD